MTARPPAKRLTGLNPLAYIGVEPLSPANFIINLRDPGITDNQNYNIGDFWLNAVTEDPWMLVNLDQGDATWIPFGSGTGILSLTGNSGGPVFGDVANNVNTIADPASNLTITGNPGTNTLTLFTSSGGSVGLSLSADVGGSGSVPFDAAGNIQIFGGSNIDTLPGLAPNRVEVHLDDVIRWPNTNAGGTTGVIYLNGTSGAGGDRFMHNAGGDQTSAFLGINSGNLSSTGTNNVGIGFQALRVEGGFANTAVGSNALSFAANNFDNVAVGSSALENCDEGNFNVAVGSSALGALDGIGSANTAVGALAESNNANPLFSIALGFQAATLHVGGERDNIIIGHEGEAAENNTIRIGTQGNGSAEQNRNFQAGIIGVTVSNPVNVVIDSVTTQLGVGNSNGVCGDNLFIATQPTSSFVFTATPRLYQMGTTGGGALTTVYDPDAVFFPGNGSGMPATFTAPATGRYQFIWEVSLGSLSGFDWVIQRIHLGYVINGVRASNVYNKRIMNFLPSTSGFDRFWSTATTTLTAIIPLTAADVMTFEISLTGTVENIGAGIGFQNGTAAGTTPGFTFTGSSNFIEGYRVD